jgi:hypothetical protein
MPKVQYTPTSMIHLPVGEHKLRLIQAQITHMHTARPIVRSLNALHVHVAIQRNPTHASGGKKLPKPQLHPYTCLQNLRTLQSRLTANAALFFQPDNLITSASPKVSLPVHQPYLLDKALQHALAPKTMSNYTSAVTRFTAWCDNNRIPHQDHFPATDSILSHYAASFASNMAGLTAANALAALKTWHVFNGAPWNASPQLPLVL